MNSIIKYIYHSLLILLSIVFFTLFVFGIVLNTFLFSSNQWTKKAIVSSYSKELTDSINDSIIIFLSENEIEINDSKKVFSEKQVEDDLSCFFKSIFQRKQKEVSCTSSSLQLNNGYIKKNELNEGIKNIYNKKLYNQITLTIGLRFSLFKQIIGNILFVLLIILIFLNLLIYFSCKKIVYLYIRHITYIISSTSIIIIYYSKILTQKSVLLLNVINDQSQARWIKLVFKTPITVLYSISFILMMVGIVLSIYSYLQHE